MRSGSEPKRVTGVGEGEKQRRRAGGGVCRVSGCRGRGGEGSVSRWERGGRGTGFGETSGLDHAGFRSSVGPLARPIPLCDSLTLKKSASSWVASARGLFFQAQRDLGTATPPVRTPAPAASTLQQQR